MEGKEYIIEKNESMPVVAICYDFDKTLTPRDMQEQGYIQTVYGENVQQFWEESNRLASENNMDQNLAYMLKMMQESRGREIFTKEKLNEYGKNIELYNGLPDWFDAINCFGKEVGVIVEHYIISSGLKEIIDGTNIRKYFKYVYASQYYRDEKDVCIWPAQVVNYTNKTQFLFRISKGVLDVNDIRVNDKFNRSQIRIPFSNIVYIGDSDTDIPCMKIVKEKGGHSIGVFDSSSPSKIAKILKLYKDNRINYFSNADYSINGNLYEYVINIIELVKVNSKLENSENDNLIFANDYNKNTLFNDENYKKEICIDELENSNSFSMTHTVVSKISKYNSWSENQIIRLCKAALYNSQVKWILKDIDISRFYKSLNLYNINDENVKKVIESINL